MQKAFFFCALLGTFSLAACNKTADGNTSSISLTPSTATATTGQTVAVTLTSAANASKWTVSPSTAKARYSVTTAKVNYFTFTQPGIYTVAVSAKTVAYDSTVNQSLDSCWAHTKSASACVKGIDSASAMITVTN